MSYLLGPAEKYEEIYDRDKFDKELVSFNFAKSFWVFYIKFPSTLQLEVLQKALRAKEERPKEKHVRSE